MRKRENQGKGKGRRKMKMEIIRFQKRESLIIPLSALPLYHSFGNLEVQDRERRKEENERKKTGRWEMKKEIVRSEKEKV